MKTLPIINELDKWFSSKGYNCAAINHKTLVLNENESYPRLIFVVDIETNLITVATDPKRMIVEIKATDRDQLLTKLFKLNNLKENFRNMYQPIIYHND
jgi:hypothetical protein